MSIKKKKRENKCMYEEKEENMNMCKNKIK
jgi:hypothetical protein